MDLDPPEVQIIRDRLLDLMGREGLSSVDVGALAEIDPYEVRRFRSAKKRASFAVLRALIAAFPELAVDLPVEIRCL